MIGINPSCEIFFKYPSLLNLGCGNIPFSGQVPRVVGNNHFTQMVLAYWFGPLVQANQVAKRGKVYIFIYLFILFFRTLRW
jgi:hypothetical protein